MLRANRPALEPGGAAGGAGGGGGAGGFEDLFGAGLGDLFNSFFGGGGGGFGGGGFGGGGGGFGGGGASLGGAAFGRLALLLLAGGLDGALTGDHLALRQAAGGSAALAAALGRLRTRRFALAALGRRRRGQVAGRRRVRTHALGFNHHRLGAAVAEALLHDAGADRPLTGLQRDGRSPAGVGTRPTVFVLVAHALACTSAGGSRPKTVRSIRERGLDVLPEGSAFPDPSLRSGSRSSFQVPDRCRRRMLSHSSRPGPRAPRANSPTNSREGVGESLITARRPKSSDQCRARQGAPCVSHSPHPRPNPIHRT